MDEVVRMLHPCPPAGGTRRSRKNRTRHGRTVNIAVHDARGRGANIDDQKRSLEAGLPSGTKSHFKLSELEPPAGRFNGLGTLRAVRGPLESSAGRHRQRQRSDPTCIA